MEKESVLLGSCVGDSDDMDERDVFRIGTGYSSNGGKLTWEEILS
jgi:hypothetical protein